MDGVRKRSNKFKRYLLVLFASGFFIGAANANPVLDNVAAGNVSVQQSPGYTEVQQQSDRAILNWHSFNIGAGEHTHFQQAPGGVALNRIDPGQGASQIFGRLSATGQIILINQAGVYFQSGSQVDVGGIIVSTSNMSDANFLAGKYIFDEAGSGYISNKGIITAQHGLVALAGNNVSNEGKIIANAGSVVLASGKKFTVDLTGNKLIHFAVDEEITQSAKGPDGQPLKAGVSNSGSIVADGGKIIMTAKAAKNVLDNVINMSGVAQANSVQEVDGEIILSAGKEGNVRVSGTMLASGQKEGERGGKIKVLGNIINIDAPAVLDVSGYNGGGEILIGGNYQGKGPEQNAWSTYIAPGTLINADAIQFGNGGKIIAWADGGTKVSGSLSARGGALGGDGGFIETSGHEYLDVAGIKISTEAPKGKVGDWLLDPADITICTGCTTTAAFNGTNTYSEAATNSNLFVDDLTSLLGTTNVTVQTTGTGAGGNGDIFVNTAISWTSNRNLILSAWRNIELNAGIDNSAPGTIATLTLTAGTSGTGAINFNSAAVYSVEGGTTINSPVVLNANQTFITAGFLLFASTINGAFDLDLQTTNTSLAAIGFYGNVGTTTSLDSLVVRGEVGSASGGIYIGDIAGTGGDVTIQTTGNQTYNGPVYLSADTSTTAKAITFNAANIAFQNDATAAPSNESIALNSGSPRLHINTAAGGTVSFTGNVTADTIAINTSAATSTFGTTTFHSGNQAYGTSVITSTGALVSSNGQGYTTNVALGGDTNFVDGSSDSINFTRPITGNDFALSVNTSFSGVVFANGSTPLNLSSLSISAPTTNLGGAWNVTTSGDQTYGVTTGGGNVSLTSTGGNINFDGSFSATSLTASASSGDINIADTISTTADQTYLTPIVLSGATPRTLATNLGDMTFNGITGGNGTLSLQSNGNGSLGSTFTLNGDITNLNLLSIEGDNPPSAGNPGAIVLTTNNATRNWNITGSNSGNITGLGGGITSFTFNNIQSVQGGSSTDNFNFSGSGSLGSINGGTSGTKTIDLSGLSGVTTFLTVSNAGTNLGFGGQFTANSTTTFDNISTFTPTSDSGNTFTGDASTNTYDLTGTNSFTFTNPSVSQAFSGFPNISGLGTTTDTYNFTANYAGTISTFAPTNNFNFAANTTFSSATISNSAGSTNTYTFNDNSRFTGTLTGGGSSSTSNFNFNAYTTPVTYTLGSLTSGSVTNSSSQTVVAFSSVAGGTITGNSAGTSSMQLPSNNTTTTFSGTNGFTVVGSSGGTKTFSQFRNVTGGSGTNTFNFGDNSILTGSLTGGSGTNTVSFSAYTTPVNLALTSMSAGTARQSFGGNAVITSFSNIPTVTGSSSSTLTGPSLATTWAITGNTSGTATNSGNTFTFSNFGTVTGGGVSNIFDLTTNSFAGTLAGGTGTNTFNIGAGGTYSGTIAGGSGTNNYVFGDNAAFTGTLAGSGSSNTLNFTAYTSPISLTMSSESAGTAFNNSSSVIATFSGMNTGFASSGSTLNLPTSKGNAITILADASGSFNDPFNFSNFTSIFGSAADTLSLPSNAEIISNNAPTSLIVLINGVQFTFFGVPFAGGGGGGGGGDVTETLNQEKVEASQATTSGANQDSPDKKSQYFEVEQEIIDDMLNEFEKQLELDQEKLKINLNCGGAL